MQVDGQCQHVLSQEKQGECTVQSVEHESQCQFLPHRFRRGLLLQPACRPAAQEQSQKQLSQYLPLQGRRRQIRRRDNRRVHQRIVLAKSSALRSSSTAPVSCTNNFSSDPALCWATSSSGLPSSNSFPLSMMITRSQTRSTTSRMCEL